MFSGMLLSELPSIWSLVKINSDPFHSLAIPQILQRLFCSFSRYSYIVVFLTLIALPDKNVSKVIFLWFNPEQLSLQNLGLVVSLPQKPHFTVELFRLGKILLFIVAEQLLLQNFLGSDLILTSKVFPHCIQILSKIILITRASNRNRTDIK